MSGESYVVNVYGSHSSDNEKTFACCDTYVHCRPQPSWEKLTSVLYEEDEVTAVELAKQFLPPRGMLILLMHQMPETRDLTMCQYDVTIHCVP